jgi:hypothetical protein
VGPARFERATSCSGGKRSIQLSYGPLVQLTYSRRRSPGSTAPGAALMVLTRNLP